MAVAVAVAVAADSSDVARVDTTSHQRPATNQVPRLRPTSPPTSRQVGRLAPRVLEPVGLPSVCLWVAHDASA